MQPQHESTASIHQAQFTEDLLRNLRGRKLNSASEGGEGPNSIKEFGLSFGLKNSLRFHLESGTYANYYKFISVENFKPKLK